MQRRTQLMLFRLQACLALWLFALMCVSLYLPAKTEDLQLLMQKMENWAHRLYPKLQFEDFIDRLETLGSKKEVQV